MIGPLVAGAGPSPWTARQRLVAAALVGLGFAGLVAGYVGTSGTLRVSRQVLWLNLAGFGLLASGAGVVLCLTSARRRIGRRRLSLFGDVPAAAAAPAPAPAAAGDDLVSAPTMTRYHRAGCSFVNDKTGLAAATADAHHRAGRRPCGVCLPEEES